MAHSGAVNDTRERDASVDVARGVSIVAIVLGHVLLGLTSAGIVAGEGGADVVVRGLYLFHLSTFAYLSGLFVARGVDRAGPRDFAVRRVALFAWLYVLWGVAQGAVRALAGSATNGEKTWGQVLELWIPEGQLWFLPWLMAATVIAVVVTPWGSTSRAVAAVSGASALAIAVWGLEPPWVFTRGWALLAPFLLGCAVTSAAHRRVFAAPRLRWVLLVGGLAAWVSATSSTAVVLPTTQSDARTAAGIALGVVGCVGGTVACLSLSAVLARTSIARPVAALGRYSLEIFLSHIIVVSGTRVILTRAGMTDAATHVVLGVVLGLLVPVVLARAVARMRWTWVFGLPIREGRPAWGVTTPR